jgi:hypothetical protein
MSNTVQNYLIDSLFHVPLISLIELEEYLVGWTYGNFEWILVFI